MTGKYISYWDDVIRKWAAEGRVPVSEKCWFTPDSPLRRELMPEPYWGDPDNCSAVLLNYNPGGPDGEPDPDDNCHYNHVVSGDISKISGAMHDHYSRIALEFPWFDRQERNDFTSDKSHKRTKSWLRQRAGWISRLVSGERKPFFLDLCGWHSKNWRLREYTVGMQEYISEHIQPLLRETISKSELGIGLCVGKQIGDEVLPKLGYSDVTAELGFDVRDASRGWQPLTDVNRWYRVYRSEEGLYIVNTWAVGSNRQPGARFKGKEKEIIDKIRNKQ